MKRERIITYNALRGIAAVMILFSHMSYLKDAVNPFWNGAWAHYMHGCAVVTTFFFLTSGFFLNYTWKDQPFGKYVVGKLKRIYPLTIIVFVMALMVDVALSGNDIVSEGVRTGSAQWFFNIAANVLLFKAFIPVQSTFYSFHGPSWYISVLFAFYLVAYGFVRGLRGRNRSKWLKYTWGICILAYVLELVVCVLVRVAHWPSLYPCYVNPYFRILGEGLAGILLCEYMPQIQRRIPKRSIPAIEIVALVVFLLDAPLRVLLPLNISFAWIQILPLGLMMIACRQGRGPVSGLLKGRALQFMGDISFELYMTHAFVYEGLPIVAGVVSKALRDWLVYHAGTRFVITFIACVIFAWIAHQFMALINKKIVYRT